MSNCFTPALSKSAIKAISMMASRVSFVSGSKLHVTMPNGYELDVERINGVFYVDLVRNSLRWFEYARAYDEYTVIGLCGKVAGGLI